MRRLALLSRRVLALGLAVVACAAGCNAILDNEPGVLGSDAMPDTPSDPDDAAARDRGPSSQEGGTGAAPVSGDSPDAADAGGCAPGSKACGDLCVSPDDPFFGCAGPSCARCDPPHATAVCVAGACAVGACLAGFADCNADPSDGCETDLSTIVNCGACGIVCPSAPHVAVACVAGACTGVCEPGWGDCNAKPKDGCEKNLTKDNRNCGECGARCVIGHCDLGTCVWP